MAITKAEIMTAVNKNLGLSLSGTDIDAVLGDALSDLTGRGDFLAGSQTITTVAGTSEYDLAADCKGVSRIVGLEKKVLDDIDRVNAGKPEGWAVWNKKIVLHPVPDGVYTLTVEIFRVHPKTPDSIELSDRFAYALKALVTAQVARSFERFDTAAVWDNEYEKALAALADSQIDRVRRVRYREF